MLDHAEFNQMKLKLVIKICMYPQLSIIFLREFDHSLRNIWTFKKHWNKLIEPYMDSLLCRVLDKAVFQPSSMSACFFFIQYKNKHDFCSINMVMF